MCFHPTDSQEDSEDQSKVIVGVVVGLLIVAGLMGLIYWFYMKNFRYGWIKMTLYTCESPEWFSVLLAGSLQISVDNFDLTSVTTQTRKLENWGEGHGDI